MSDVRVRFAPSPTGLLHIGGARTALFNWLYARHTGGVFVLRIEDTDKARNTPEARAVIFQGMKWLGLDWDEGPQEDGTVIGNRGPYHQSERAEIYKKYIEKLLNEDKAYEDEGAIRFKMPKTECVIQDLICGEVRFDRSGDSDLVIQRSDGSPVFHLVNVVDDLEMGMTHVIRGEDHLSNTPKHLALFEAFGVEAPKYAHIPLILNPGGSKMSKRDEGASVEEYQKKGYLAEAVRNYLCLLGWSPKDDREVIPIEEIIEKFDLKNVNRSNAKFDKEKLVWMCGEYWNQKDEKEFQSFAIDYLSTCEGLLFDFKALLEQEKTYCDGVLVLVKEKVKIGKELVDWVTPFFDEAFAYDEKAEQKIFKKSGALEKMKKVQDQLKAVELWSVEKIEAALGALAEKEEQKVTAFFPVCRFAVSGKGFGPSLFHVLEVMGKERVLSRFERTLEQFKEK